MTNWLVEKLGLGKKDPTTRVRDLSEEFSDLTEILAEEKLSPEARQRLTQRAATVGQARDVARSESATKKA
jgi:hypothetical protein